jgi:uncharacterized repeat protein (TIGR03803 family)
MKTRLHLLAFWGFATLAALPVAGQTSNTFTVLYQFNSTTGEGVRSGGGLALGPDGQSLYGTCFANGYNGVGTIFVLTPNGSGGYTHQDLYSFAGGTNDGGNPYAGLTWYSNAFWGTCQTGGSNGYGTVFSFNPDPSEHTVHHLTAKEREAMAKLKASQEQPDAGLFGNSAGGGPTSEKGAVFDVSDDEFSDVVEFDDFGSDGGDAPSGALAIEDAGGGSKTRLRSGSSSQGTNVDLSKIILYGVTQNGGSNNWGTIYKVQADGSNFMVLHECNLVPSDGATPVGGMVLSGNVLYGTASAGGSNYNGAVFKINTDGTGYQNLFSFNYATTGDAPEGDLILVGNTLYGTTYIGGVGGGGTVFSIDTSGQNFTVLYNFSSPMYDGSGNYTNSDGGWALAGLLYNNYTLYGLTPYGGATGGGTAFAIKLPAPPSLAVTALPPNLTLSWPSSASNYVLQTTQDLGGPWSNYTGLVSNGGTNMDAVIATAGSNAYFRLLSTNGL